MCNLLKNRVYIKADVFRDALELNDISIRDLGNPDSTNYVGVSEKTIRRGIKNGWYSKNTMRHLSKVINMNRFVTET